MTERSNLLTEPIEPFQTIWKCHHCELNFNTDKGREIFIGKAYTTISQQGPEKESSSFLVKEPPLTITPTQMSAREGEIDAVIPEEIIDCEVKTEVLHKCDDCDFRTHVETEMMNHTQIKHKYPT